jgi:phosphatidylinositol dimannoside acyltransferase
MTDAGDDQQHPEGERPRAHERLFWRRLAHWGASHGPEWFLRYSPPVFGWAAAALVPEARRAVVRNLRRVRGERGPVRDAREVLVTFGSYASCLAEVLSNDAPGGPRLPGATVYGERFFNQAKRMGKGVIMVTAHTGGWETVGPLLALEHGRKMTFVMAPERDPRARKLHDEARRKSGVAIAHVGSDPLASLSLLRELRAKGLVALQIDRLASGMRARTVELLGAPGQIPEGPLRLAQISGAPILPAFCARVGHRQYVVRAFAPQTVSRQASERELDDAAQHLATSMSTFLKMHPTQWFHFE